MKKIITLLVLFLFVPILEASPPLRQNTYVTGTTIRSNDVTANEDEIFGYLQVGVDTIRTDGLNSITEIDSSLKSGSDQTLVTGSAGSDEELGIWNGDGDIIGLSQITGNTTGVKVPGLLVSNLVSCDTIDSSSTGQLSNGS